MTKVVFLGTNTYPRDRESTSILIDNGEEKIVLDCCGGILKQLDRSSCNPAEIGHVFLSHVHGDHILGLPWLLMGSFIMRTQYNVRGVSSISIYGAKEVCDAAFKIAQTCFAKPMDALQKMVRLRLVAIDGENQIRISDNCLLQPIPAKHSTPTFGCKILFEKPSVSIVYSADTRPNEALAAIAQEADLLIHDAYVEDSRKEFALRTYHSTAKEAAEIAESARARTLALVHISEEYHGKENVLLEEARKIFKGRTILPHDLESLTF